MSLRERFIASYPSPDDVRMTLGEHLEELRSRLIRMLVGLLAGAAISFVFVKYIMAFLTWPMFAILARQGYETKMSIFNPAENFMTDIKIALIVGFIVSAPYGLMQLWGFVAAGLYKNERKWINRFAPVSIGLFFTGVAFLLIIVSPLLLDFLVSYRKELPNLGKYMPSWVIPGTQPAPLETAETEIAWPTAQPIPAFDEDPADPPEGMTWVNRSTREIRIRFGDTTYTTSRLKKAGQRNRIEPNMRISEYVMWLLHLAAAFGIGFQVPVVVAFMAALGIAEAKDMARLRRYVWFGMGVMAAMITPPDVTSMLFLLLPMALLYEIGLIAARFIERERPST